ncbi:MAG TPA: ATP-binding protein [Verrucomicrobiales bacterium]|nr:ATP-binding protein [Verrucomicrobiales bacterium]
MNPSLESPTRVLLVEDLPADARMIRELLREGAGENAFDVVQAPCLRAARDLLQDPGQFFDAILLDMHLPDSDPESTAKEVHRIAPELPIVVITGLEDDDLRHKTIADGVQDFLTKAELHPPVLVRSILYAVNRQRLFNEIARSRERTAQQHADSVVRAEKALRDSQALYESLVENLVQNIFRKDLQGRFTFANSNFCRNAGKSREDIIGRTDFDLFPPDLAAKYQGDDQRVLLSGEPLETEEAYESADGQRLVVRVVKTPVHDAAGTIIGMQGIFWDVTAERRAQEELQARTIELERSNRDLEQFAYIASHDLKEPLRMVISYVQLLDRRYAAQLDNDARDFIRFAVDGARRMQQLINDLLVYSRAGTRHAEDRTIELEDILRDALSNLEVALEESGAGVHHDPLPKVKGDPTQLVQLFQNLIGNAVKFRRDRRPEIHLSAEKADRRHWMISIRDNGIGIEERHRDRIFQIFQRLHGREEYPGTGIGLAVCRKIVERHGGRIWVESEPDRGSTFRFTLLAALDSDRKS